jgi:hypothetical protein
MKIKFFISLISFALTLAIVAAGQRPRQTPRAKPRAAPSPSPTAVPTPSPTPTPSLDSLDDFEVAKSDSARFSKTIWSLTLNYHQPEYPAKTALDLSADLDKPEILDEHKELRPYQRELKTITLRMGVLGGSLTYFLYGKDRWVFPLRLVRYKQTKCLVAYVASDTVYNTLRLNSAKQRAAKAASSNALPILRELARTLKDTDINTVAVFVTYGTKDFLEKSVGATKAEILAILSSKSDAQAFADGEQSDTDFLKKALVLISDRDANDFTRVELQLD